MAQMIPLLTLAATGYGVYNAKKQGDQAQASSEKAQKTATQQQAAQTEKQNKAEFDQRQQLGSRRRLMNMRSGGPSTLFGGYGGSQSTVG